MHALTHTLTYDLVQPPIPLDPLGLGITSSNSENTSLLDGSEKGGDRQEEEERLLQAQTSC